MHSIIIMYNIMNIFKILNNFYSDLQVNPSKNVDPQLVKYFKTEFGSSWELELDKYIIRNEANNDKKAA